MNEAEQIKLADPTQTPSRTKSYPLCRACFSFKY
jgi:hypothetical protein